MNKVIYEFHYVVGGCNFNACYDCIVDKETNKMLYGNVFYQSGTPSGQRFAINKENLNQVHSSIDRYRGLVYRVQIDSKSRKDATKKARKIIYNHMMNFIEIFKKDYEN